MSTQFQTQQLQQLQEQFQQLPQMQITTKSRAERKGKPHVPAWKGKSHKGIDFNDSDVRHRTDNPNRDKEDITDIHSIDGIYHITFKPNAKQKAAEWKKTLQENKEILIEQSGELTISFSDLPSLRKALRLMVESKFIEKDFFVQHRRRFE